MNQKTLIHSPFVIIRLSLFLLSAATLAFEINLTRLFSVAQFYHFAFMIVSIALLGFGASGTTLAIFPVLGQKHPKKSISWLAIATGLSMLGAFVLINWQPFDSFSIAWDRRQIGILVVHYIALAMPFYFTGMAVGLLLTAFPRSAGHIYAINLSGSAIGCLIALIAPVYLGGEGTVLLSAALAAFAALISGYPHSFSYSGRFNTVTSFLSFFIAGALFILITLTLGMRFFGSQSFSWLDLNISPYKSQSYALLYPDAKVVYERWNSFSKVDIVRSEGIRSLPGLSYRYLNPPPKEDGLFVDGDNLSPVVQTGFNESVFDFLPTAIAFELRTDPEVLILEPRGGLEILTALSLGSQNVTVVEKNSLIIDAANHIYDQTGVEVQIETGRSYIQRSSELFDIVILSLTSSYHPVRSGAYSLGEDYRYTVESFQDALGRLKPDGLLIINRWLQDPPSETLRVFAIAVTALEKTGANPQQQVVAFRGYNMGTILVKNQDFSINELEAINEFTSERAFDLIYTPNLETADINQHNILPEPVYYSTFTALLNSKNRENFYREYPFEISPPTDDKPFFGHFFKWSQYQQVIAELGKTWQPFGGAGYFVIFALLILASILATLLIVLPVIIHQMRIKSPAQTQGSGEHLNKIWLLVYFGLLGFAFLFVEIPLIQSVILYLGHPSYALTIVLFTVLFFSGLGSQMSSRVPIRFALGFLVLLLLLLPFMLPTLYDYTLGYSFPVRVGLIILILAPVGFLMGIPFPAGIRAILGNDEKSPHIPWIWAVNGSTSVISSILAALLALSFGFSWVLRLGALCYAAAWLAIRAINRPVPARSPNQ
jgi:hypothetical protein